MESNIYEEKWAKFLKRVRLFRFVPFTEFVIAAGSLATGRMHERSDFDVVVGVRGGRIFTNRLFAHVIFGLLGYRRKGSNHKADASDKICLSHFVTPASFRLGGTKNAYWQHLYRSLVPVMGREDALAEFFDANDWLKPRRVYERHERYLGPSKSWLKSFLELILGGRFGDWMEERLGGWQIKRIVKGLPESLGYKPHLVYSYEELRFHVDTRRIDEIVERGEV